MKVPKPNPPRMQPLFRKRGKGVLNEEVPKPNPPRMRPLFRKCGGQQSELSRMRTRCCEREEEALQYRSPQHTNTQV